MLFAVRLTLCALVAVAPLPSAWTLLGAGDGSDAPAAAVAAVVQIAEGHVVRSPADGSDPEDEGEEEATLDSDDHRMPTEPAHGAVFHASDERTIRYPTDRPPRRFFV